MGATGTPPSVPGCEETLHAYAVYGLSLRSVLPLPAAVSQGGAMEVEVKRATLTREAGDLRARGFQAQARDGEAHLLIPGAGTIVVRAGREILVDPEPRADERIVQLAVLGPAFAALLQQRGILVLHGSAVEMAGAAAVFVGGCGAGKSTMAAALHARGHRLIADDTVAVRTEGDDPVVLPAYPQLKLWPDAVVALGGDPARWPRIDPLYAKRARETRDGFCSRTAVPFRHLYVLRTGRPMATRPLGPAEAFLELVRHSYGVQWLHGASSVRDFAARMRLVRRTRIVRLRRPPALEHLHDVARLVEEDVGAH